VAGLRFLGVEVHLCSFGEDAGVFAGIIFGHLGEEDFQLLQGFESGNVCLRCVFEYLVGTIVRGYCNEL
jgi:hypothetical protein